MPQSTSLAMLNLLADASFAEPGSRVDYIIEVPADGWYQIAFTYRQRAKNGFPVFYDLLINGELPSDAASLLMFPTARSFTTMTVPAPDGSPQTFYLTRGQHTLSIVLNIQPLRGIFEEIDALFNEMSATTAEIIQLTGGITVDTHRDYKLEEHIPGLKERLLDWADRCDAMHDSLVPYMPNGRSAAFSNLTSCAKALRRLARRPEDLPRRLSELSRGPASVTRNLAAMLESMNNNAVGLDKIIVFGEDANLPKPPSVLASFWFSVQRFFMSFRINFYSTADTNEEHLQVWMARPRQYVELLQNMIDSQFTPQTGIKVDLSIMPDAGKLTLASAAGSAPDVALSVGYVLPSYLSIRGALYDLKQFDDFTEVARRFPEGMFVPYISEGGVYGLPETVNFWVMFYRSDIFSSLEIPIPNDMDEVKAILPELQRRSMDFFFPTAGMVGVKAFPGTMPLIVQSGGAFFGDTIGHTTLDSDSSLQGFREMTELFTIFDMAVDVPAPGFYQQFRNGSMPIGISDLGTYNLLNTSAPELSGLWELAMFPGLRNEDGEVLRYTTGGAEAAIMFADTDKPDEAWEFLKWWLSDEVQAEFGNTLQSVYGRAFLWNTANTAAFSQLPIQASHRQVILEQAKWAIEVPWVPGTYMVERELSNAYNSVVIDGMTVRRAMDIAVKRINREMDRKLEEFGFITSTGEILREFPTPNTSVLWED
jgi:ABC-type glycerol-3-phosphate transport system substrate-binding protein